MDKYRITLTGKEALQRFRPAQRIPTARNAIQVFVLSGHSDDIAESLTLPCRHFR